MSKTDKIIGKNINLERLATRIENYLTENKFEVAFARDVTGESHKYLIQARKSGFLRSVSGSRRSTDIEISGTPNDFEVSIGTGEWGKNLVTSAPLFVIPIVGIAATITKLYTAKKFETNLRMFVKDQIQYLKHSHHKDQPTDIKEYACDYVEGYPGWNSPISDATMILEYKKGQSCLVFKNKDGNGLKIPANRIEKAEIISKTSKLEHPDRMIQLTFKNESDNTLKVVFNFDDVVIRGVLAGIDELVSETKLEKMTLVASH